MFTLKEKIFIVGFDLLCFTTFAIFATLLNAIIVGIAFLSVFAIVNSFIPDDKRIHADRLLHCFILSTIFLVLCVILYKVGIHYMSNVDSFIMCICVILLGNFTTTYPLWWGGNDLNKRVFDWVRYNPNNPDLVAYENKLKEVDNKKYIIFRYRFREFKSYSQISKIMKIDIQRISEEINIISHFIEFSIRMK